VSGQCLSSSLHNQFITFYRKTLGSSRAFATEGLRGCLGTQFWSQQAVGLSRERADGRRQALMDRAPSLFGDPLWGLQTAVDQLQPKTPKVIWLAMPWPVSASVRTPTTKPIMAVRPFSNSARSRRSLRICAAAAFWNQSSLGVEEAMAQLESFEILSRT